MYSNNNEYSRVYSNSKEFSRLYSNNNEVVVVVVVIVTDVFFDFKSLVPISSFCFRSLTCFSISSHLFRYLQVTGVFTTTDSIGRELGKEPNVLREEREQDVKKRRMDIKQDVL